MDIFKYLSSKGIDTVDAGFYNTISNWRSWYQSDVPKFHRYTVYQGRNTKIPCRRLSLGMAKTACEDIANFLLNERVTLTIDGDENYDFVKSVLDGANWQVNGNRYQEWKAAEGTVAYVPYCDYEMVGDEIVGGKIKIDYVIAENIYPTSWENGIITECAFAFPHIVGGKKYVHMQYHHLIDGLYVIENMVVKCTSRGAIGGQDMTPDEWRELAPFRNLAAIINTGSPEPQFVIDTLNRCNNADPTNDGNPMGISVFANAVDILRKIDTEYDSYQNEFVNGRKRLFVAPELLQFTDGTPAFDPNEAVFYVLPEDSLANSHEAIHETNMTLRTTEHSQAIGDDLDFLSVKCGFGHDHYQFTKGQVQTATGIISSNSDLYKTIQKEELVLDKVLRSLVRIILRLGVTCKITGLNPDANVKVNFDDSIIEDTTALMNRDRADVIAGIMSRAEYRAKWYGETLEQAKERVPEQDTGIMM